MGQAGSKDGGLILARHMSMSREDYAWQCYTEAVRSFEREGGWWRPLSALESITNETVALNDGQSPRTSPVPPPDSRWNSLSRPDPHKRPMPPCNESAEALCKQQFVDALREEDSWSLPVSDSTGFSIPHHRVWEIRHPSCFVTRTFSSATKRNWGSFHEHTSLCQQTMKPLLLQV